MKPVFGYLRVSGKGQMDGDGFDRQRETIERFCARTGRRVIRWFTDGAVSGETDTADREGFAEMMSLAGDGTTTSVVVERADRLGRTLAVCEIACEEARKGGVQILEAASETDLTNSDDPTRVLIRQVLGSLAEWNKNVQVKRLRAARDRKRQREGKCEGRKKTPIPDEVQSLIRVMKGRGATLRDIARELTRRQFITPQGKSYWHPSTIALLWTEMNREPELQLRRDETILDGLAA